MIEEIHLGKLLLSTLIKSYRLNARGTERYALGLMSKLISSHFKREKFQGKNGFYPPRFTTINPTDQCQLDCKGCSTRSERLTHQEGFPYETLNELIKNLDDMGVIGNALLGGEPLVESSKKIVLPLIENNPDKYFAIVTNAIGLDDRCVKTTLANWNVFWYLSLNGMKEKSEKVRGEGSFSYTERAMKLLASNRIPFGASVVVSKNNWGEVSSKEFLGFLADNGAVNAAFLQMAPIDEYCAHESLSIEERGRFSERLKKTLKEGRITGINYAEEVKTFGCSAGKRHYYITSKGEVMLCNLMSASLGNIKNDSFENIISSGFARDYRTLSASYPPSCLASGAPGKIRELAVKHGLKIVGKELEFMAGLQ